MHNSGIYKISFPNITDKVYIGYTSDVKRRTKQHNVSAFSATARDKDCPIHRAIKKYGRITVEHNVTLLEYIEPDNFSLMQEREKYWINYYDSYDKGYNLTLGGDGASAGIYNSSAKLNAEQLQEIYDLLRYQKDMYIYEIAERYNISSEAVSDINLGKRYHNNNLIYPLRKDTKFSTGHFIPSGVDNHLSKFSQEDIDKIYDLLENDQSSSLEDISQQMGVCYATISYINRGLRYAKDGYEYPIRKQKKKTNKFTEDDIQEIYDLLRNTKTSMKEIAAIKHCSYDTIRRINSGKTYPHEYTQYPIRST